MGIKKDIDQIRKLNDNQKQINIYLS